MSYEQNEPYNGFIDSGDLVLGADEKTRTSMELPPLVPETSASTIPPHPHINCNCT